MHFYRRHPLVLPEEHLPEDVPPKTSWVVTNFDHGWHLSAQTLTFFLREEP